MALTYAEVASRQSELSFFPPQNFYLHIDKLSSVSFTCQQVQIPTLTGGEVDLPNRFNSGRVFVPGDSLDYGTLDVTFLLDKQLRNYRQILDWLKSANSPETTDQYDYEAFKDTMSDLTIFAADADNTPLSHWSFKNAFPISLDGIQFDATQQDVEYLVASVSFRFTYFEHQTYTNGTLNNDLL